MSLGAFYGTFLNHWPPDISALSIPSCCHIFSEQDCRAFLSQQPEIRNLIGYKHRLQFSNTLLHWIDQTIALFQNTAFVRLGACSFVTEERKPKPIRSVEQVVKLMMHPGIRAASIAYRSWLAKQPIALCIREWQDIQPQSEFRLFIRNKSLLGVSQYHWRCIFADIEEWFETVVHPIVQTSIRISAATVLKDVIADIYVTDLNANPRSILIELNPYSSVSDACLFTWDHGGDFDGSFRYRSPSGDMHRILLPK